MNKNSSSSVLAIIVGLVTGLVFGCLVTWYPIRLLFCEVYNTPDCEEIVLMVFPLYCLICPLIGAGIAYLIYRRRQKAETLIGEIQDGDIGMNEGEEV